MNKKFFNEEDTCQCGCCCNDEDHGHEETEEYDVVNLTLDDGTEVECAVIDLFNMDGQDYIILLPLDDEEEALFIYRYFEDDDDSFRLELIESDEEYQKVCDEFEKNNDIDE